MRHLVRTAIITSLITVFSVTASAATAPADAIKYRKAVMSGLAAHVGGFLLINFGKVDHPEYLLGHAEALANLGAQGKVLFPAGTDVGKTDALPLIWKEPDQFNKLLAELETSSTKLRDAVVANDKPGTQAAFKALGEACKNCHDRYRKKED